MGISLREIIPDERWQHAVATASGGEAVRLTLPAGVNIILCDLAPLHVGEVRSTGTYRVVVILQDISAETEGRRNRLDAVVSAAEGLRTPVITIANYAELLLNEEVGTVPSGQRRYLSRIRADAERLLEMTDRLIQAGGAGGGWSQPERQWVDINKLIEGTVIGSQSQLDGRGIVVELDLAEDLPAVQADPDGLRRVMSNLLSNASLASQKGAVIRVQSAESSQFAPGSSQPALNGNGFVVVSVRDSGGGLSDDALDRAFDQQRPSQTPQGLGGSGADLALVKTLIEEHGGHLWVESEKGAGTTFSFVLPINDAKDHSERRIGAIV
jgi:signal transduction histidine kinase